MTGPLLQWRHGRQARQLGLHLVGGWNYCCRHPDNRGAEWTYPVVTTTPRRRWFRFSLRTLFVVVTVFAAWLGWELNWIRERRLIANGAPRWVVFDTQLGTQHLVQPKAPGILWIFGEPGYAAVRLVVCIDDQNGDEDKEIMRAKGLFPESLVELATVPKCNWIGSP